MDLAATSAIVALFGLFVLSIMLLNKYWEKKQNEIDEKNNRKANFDWEYHNNYNRKVFGDDFI